MEVIINLFRKKKIKMPKKPTVSEILKKGKKK